MVTINRKFLKLLKDPSVHRTLNSIHLRDFAQTKVNSWIIGTEITGPRVEPAKKRPLLGYELYFSSIVITPTRIRKGGPDRNPMRRRGVGWPFSSI